MNYYNPYIYGVPMSPSMIPRQGLFGSLFRNINFSSILNGTQRTLNIRIIIVHNITPKLLYD